MKVPMLFGIKTKIVTVVAGIVILSSYIWGAWFLQTDETLLIEKLTNERKLLLSSFKVPLLHALANEELGLADAHSVMNGVIDDLGKGGEYGALYAYIADAGGTVVAHRQLSEYGKRYNDPIGAKALELGSVQDRIVGDPRDLGSFLDLAMPLNIYGKKWGVLRAGFSLQSFQDELEERRKTIFFFSLTFFMAGTAIFSVIGRTMATPLKELARVMADVTPEMLDAELSVHRRDEIGLLQRSFTTMLERLRKSEEERQRAVSTLIQSERLAGIGKLVAGVAHEVNNPLAAMASSIYNLERCAVAGTGDDLEILRQGCSRIETIVRQLTDFTRSETLIHELVSSDQFFREMAAFARMATAKRRVRLRSEDRCKPPVNLCIDKGKLHQVVLDLLVNAADASPAGAPIVVTAFSREGAYCLSVRDCGVGVSEELQEQIFELFYTSKPAGKGTGIGLAICKSIVEKHEGTITVESRPGETVFTVMIPTGKEVPHGLDQDSRG